MKTVKGRRRKGRGNENRRKNKRCCPWGEVRGWKGEGEGFYFFFSREGRVFLFLYKMILMH